jgi:Predicted transcriptional regulator
VTAVTPESIMKVAMGFMAAKHLFVASEVGLFEALAAGPATIEELASQTGVPSRTIAIAAAAMVSLGLIEQDGDHYQNGEPAAAFLAGKPGPDLRPMLRFFDQISYPTWQKLADAVRTGNGQAQFGKFDKRNRRFSRLAWNPSPARARPRWRQITTSAAIVRFSMWPVAPARSSLRS